LRKREIIINVQGELLADYFCIMNWTFSLNELDAVAKEFWQLQKDNKVFAFHGAMGAGKTTFILSLCNVIGVNENMSSPTFSIVNEYSYNCEGTPRPVFHIDLYRLKDAEEAIRAGIEDVLHSEHLCFIEWPERAPEIFPEATVHLTLKDIGENLRILSIENQ